MSRPRSGARWWAVRPAQNRKPATYTCPICGNYLPAFSEHLLVVPEGDASRRRHAHTACVRAEREAGRLPTHDEWAAGRTKIDRAEMEGAPKYEGDLRDAALASLKRKRDFRGHVFIYVAVNAVLVAVWAATGTGFFWPIFPILGWGIGVAANAWDAYGRRPIGEDDIRREAERLQR